jgi:hypothetical protein
MCSQPLWPLEIVVVRTHQPHHPLYSSADRAIRILPEQGRKLHGVARNLIDLWAVATRSLVENGLDMTAAEAATELGAGSKACSSSCRKRG